MWMVNSLVVGIAHLHGVVLCEGRSIFWVYVKQKCYAHPLRVSNHVRVEPTMHSIHPLQLIPVSVRPRCYALRGRYALPKVRRPVFQLCIASSRGRTTAPP
jgi:hypothetical protein